MPIKCTHCGKNVSPDEQGKGVRSICPECGNELPARKKSWKRRLIILFLILSVLACLIGWAARNFLGLRTKAYDAAAKSAGRWLKLAEEVYFFESSGLGADHTTDAYTRCSAYNDCSGIPGKYTDDLAIYYTVDRGLIEEPGVTFSFLHVSASHFTFYTQHIKGTKSKFIYHDYHH